MRVMHEFLMFRAKAQAQEAEAAAAPAETEAEQQPEEMKPNVSMYYLPNATNQSQA